jgi:hypothetical protein
LYASWCSPITQISLQDGTYFDEMQGCAKPNHQRVYPTAEHDGFVWYAKA